MKRCERMLQEFIELISIDVISRKETPIAEKLIEKLKELGFEIRRDQVGETFGGECGNVLGVRKGELDGTLLLCSHMDRMPNGFGIRPVEREGVLYTDGTTILAADDVAGISVILESVRRVLESGKPLPTLEILFTVGEELCLCGSAGMDPAFLSAKEGYIFDSPGHAGRFIVKTPGRCSLECDITGKAAHAGNEPEKGIDAARVMCEIIAGMEIGRLGPNTTSNFSVLHTNTHATNVVCDHAEIRGEVRSDDDTLIRSYADQFRARCEEKAALFGAKADVRTHLDYPAMNVPDSSHVSKIAVHAAECCGLTASLEKGGGGMDANNFNHIGISTIGVGCGYGKNHTVDEYLDLEDFFKVADLAEQLILSWAEDCN